MFVFISSWSSQLDFFLEVVNNRGKSGFCGGGGGGLYFTLYRPSSSTGELSCRGNFRPLGRAAVRKNGQSQGKRQRRTFLMSTTIKFMCVHECVNLSRSLLALSLFLSISVCAQRLRWRGRVDNVTPTLEQQVSAHYCVAGQLWQTSLTNAECIIQNILHLLQHCFSNQHHSLPGQKFSFNAGFTYLCWF